MVHVGAHVADFACHSSEDIKAHNSWLEAVFKTICVTVAIVSGTLHTVSSLECPPYGLQIALQRSTVPKCSLHRVQDIRVQSVFDIVICICLICTSTI